MHSWDGDIQDVFDSARLFELCQDQLLFCFPPVGVLFFIHCCVLLCLPTPLTLVCGGSPIILLLVHQPEYLSIWPATPSLQRGLATNPEVTVWCVCGCILRDGVCWCCCCSPSVTYGRKWGDSNFQILTELPVPPQTTGVMEHFNVLYIYIYIILSTTVSHFWTLWMPFFTRSPFFVYISILHVCYVFNINLTDSFDDRQSQ